MPCRAEAIHSRCIMHDRPRSADAMSDDASLALRCLGFYPGCCARYDTQSEPTGPRIGGWLDLTDRRTILIIDFIRIADSGIQRRNSLVMIHKTLMHGDAASRSLSMPTEGPRGTDLDPQSIIVSNRLIRFCNWYDHDHDQY